mgnify:CR=1
PAAATADENKENEEEEEEKALFERARTRTTKISLFSGLRSEFPVSTMGTFHGCWVCSPVCC